MGFNYDTNTLTEGTTIYGYDLRNNLISVNKANVLYNVHTDQIGTPRVITNASNVVVWKWDNTDPYGANLPSINTIVYNKRFSGQYFDNESKLHYNYYRTYNPLVGRYIQSDPIGLAAGFNTYNYVEGNPLNGIDPNGLWLQYALPTVAGALIGSSIGFFTNEDKWQGVKEGFVTGALTGLSITGAGRIVGAFIGEGALTQISANVIGSVSGEFARQTVFEKCNYDWEKVAFAGFVGGIFSPISKPYILTKQNVVSWAEKDMVADLSSGRWVMSGYNNKRNYYLSGIVEKKYPVSNSVEGVVNGKSLTYPISGRKWEVIKGLWGQRNIK